MAARRGDTHSGGDSTSDRTDPLRNGTGSLPLPPQHEAGPSEVRALRRFAGLMGNAHLLRCTPPVPPNPPPTRRGNSEGESKDQGH